MISLLNPNLAWGLLSGRFVKVYLGEPEIELERAARHETKPYGPSNIADALPRIGAFLIEVRDMKNSSFPFVQLERSFHELASHARESDSFDLNQAFFAGSRLQWGDLLQGYRTVILSEAGSGKTKEIRQTADQLREEGKKAFFLRLEHIPDDFDGAFEVGTIEEFEEWLASTDEGWLLLDSVDEARLRNPGDFERAVRKLGRRIQAACTRARIVLTGRTSAWRSAPKVRRLTRLLTSGAQPVKAHTNSKVHKIYDAPDVGDLRCIEQADGVSFMTHYYEGQADETAISVGVELRIANKNGNVTLVTRRVATSPEGITLASAIMRLTPDAARPAN